MLLLLLPFSRTTVTAQEEEHTDFSNQMNNVFSTLEKNRVPHGLLLDYAFEFAELSNYNGVLTDTNKVSAGILRDIYSTIVMSAVHNNAGVLYSPDYIDSIWQVQRQPEIITLGGVYYNYSRFKDNALTANLLTLSGNKFYDKYVSGVWQNPYQSEKVFAMSPPLHAYRGKSFKVVLPANLWLTNHASGVSNIAVNFSDGAGYRMITPGQQMNVVYADTGRKVWTFRLKLVDNSYLYSHTEMVIEPEYTTVSSSITRYSFNSYRDTLFLTADDAYSGEAAQGWITIAYLNENKKFKKPLIVVEGFDPGYLIEPEEKFGSTNISTFLLQLSYSPNLENLLLDEYDIVYIDWKKGTDYLQRNAYLLEKVIKWVNAKKITDGCTEPNVVLGQSMGGVIARWALRDMEDRSMNHQTRLYISWDSPHQGANIPAAYQHAARHARQLYMRSSIPYTLGAFQKFRIIKNTLYLLDEPAARQMIKNRLNQSAVIDNTAHDAWQNALKAKGYPQLTRNVAVSNGSECAVDMGYQPGATIFSYYGKANTRILSDLIGSLHWVGLVSFQTASLLTFRPQFLLGVLPGKSTLTFDFVCKAQPAGTTQIYKGTITFSKKVLWVVNINTTITNRTKNAVSSVLPIDGLAGGFYKADVGLESTEIKNVLIKYNATVTSIPQFNFIPTVSALDIGGGNVSLNLSDYKTKYKGASPPITPKNSSFNSFITGESESYHNGEYINNEEHIDISPRNGNWVANELNGTPVPAGVLCCPMDALVISGPQNFCTTASYTIANLPSGVTGIWWTLTPASGMANIVLGTQGQPSVQLQRIGTGMVTLHVLVSTACDTKAASMTLYAGTLPPDQINPVGAVGKDLVPQSVYPFFTLPNLPPLGSGITDYQWEVITGGQVVNNTQNSHNGHIRTDALGTGQNEKNITVRFRWKGCEWSSWVYYYGKIVRNLGTPPISFFSVYPNPASEEITVMQRSASSQAFRMSEEGVTEQNKKTVQWIRITDMLGNVRIQKDCDPSEKFSSERIRISGLFPGQYIVYINDGETILQVPFIVNH